MPFKRNWKKFALNLTFKAITLSSILGCQTLPSPKQIPFPQDIAQICKKCASRDGSIRYYSEPGSPILLVDWVSDERAGVHAIAQNPLGQKVLELEMTRGEVNISHELNRKLTVDAEGFLRVDGHFVGLKANELPCFLGFSLPESWKNLGAFSSSQPKVVELKDERRRIEIRKLDGIKSIEASVMWPGFWYFNENKLRFNLSLTAPKLLEIEYNGSPMGSWVDADN